MIRTDFVLPLLLTVLLSIPGAAQSSSPEKRSSSSADRVVIKVGNTEVTQAEFETNIGQLEPQSEEEKDKEKSEKSRRQMGEDYASVLMLSQYAVATHLDADPDVSRQLAMGRMQVLSDAQFARLMSQTKPTADDVTQYYSAHAADFDQVRIRRLFIWKVGPGSVSTKGLAPDAARTRANAILHAPAAEAAKLAEAFTGTNDGLLDAAPIIFRRGELPPNMAKVAFALKEGEWGEAQDTPDGIILLQLFKRDREPLSEVWSLVEQRVQAQKMEARIEDLKKRSAVWLNEDYFGPAAASSPGARQPDSQLSQPGKSAVIQETNHEDVRQK